MLRKKSAEPGMTSKNRSYFGPYSGKRKGDKSSPDIPKMTKLPTCCMQKHTPTFYIGGDNGDALVEDVLSRLGWKRTPDKNDERFKLKWVNYNHRINYNSFREGHQLVNHLPNTYMLTNKLRLINSLKEYERATFITKGRLPRLKMSEFHPETYKLDEKSDRDTFLEVYQDLEIWICKTVGNMQGVGISMLRSRDEIDKLLDERDKKKAKLRPSQWIPRLIVQRYIMNPLLLEDRKFDVRAYMLVASTSPFLILYHPGYVRLSCTKYDENDQNMGVHLTNQYVQMKDPNYETMLEDTAWSMDKFNHYVNTEVRPRYYVNIEEDWVFNTFTKQMQKIMIHCFNSVKHKLQQKLGYFDLFGLDFMVDIDMNTWLIEINENPCLQGKVSCQQEILSPMVTEVINVAIECFEKTRKHQTLMPLKTLKHFTVLHCGTRWKS